MRLSSSHSEDNKLSREIFLLIFDIKYWLEYFLQEATEENRGGDGKEEKGTAKTQNINTE
jgi:hypothetical protein